MAKTKYTIEMDFRKAKEQADKLDEIASRLKAVSGDFQGTLDSLQRNWTGDNASKYIGKGNILYSDMGVTSNEVRTVAKTIRQIAENTYNTEMDALKIAESRTYGGSETAGSGGFR